MLRWLKGECLLAHARPRPPRPHGRTPGGPGGATGHLDLHGVLLVRSLPFLKDDTMGQQE